MNKQTKTIALIALFVLIIAIAVFAYNELSNKVSPQNNIGIAENNDETSQSVNNEETKKVKAPDFTVLDASGKAIKLSDFFGKPIVLNFWASWCPPCKGEMPEFNEVYKQTGDSITFMMVDLVDGQRETKEKGYAYVKNQGFSFPVYFDTGQQAASAYGISAIPTTIFIDKDGYIAGWAESAIDAETLQKGIDLIK